MNKDQERLDCFSMVTVNHGETFGGRARVVFQAFFRRGRMGAIAFITLAVLAETGVDWGLQSSRADTPLLSLQVTGPPTVTAGRPESGITIRLKNPGLAAPASRLRLLIRNEAEADISLQDGDIKIDVREGGIWKPIALEAVDGGVMGAIGTAGEAHRERHKRGGFEIGAHTQNSWQLRVTLRIPGVYSLVSAISPDNGSTQLAQPASLRMEAI